MSRIPLTVAVVGALLVGGATTGTTRASWTDQRSLAGSSVTAGQMKLAVPETAALSNDLDPTSTSTGTASFTITDQSTGKNLVHEVTAQVTGETTGLDATIGGTCETATENLVTSLPMTPHHSNRTFTPCVKVTSSTGAVTGEVTITVIADQVGGGWTSLSHEVIIPVRVSASSKPARPSVSCAEVSAGKTAAHRTFSWSSNEAGVSFTLFRSDNGGDFTEVVPSLTLNPFTVSEFLLNQERSFRVVAAKNGSTSDPSRIVKFTVNNGGNYKCEELS